MIDALLQQDANKFAVVGVHPGAIAVYAIAARRKCEQAIAVL